MYSGVSSLAGVIRARTSVISGVTGDILKSRNDAYAAYEQAKKAYSDAYHILYGNDFTATEDNSAPATPGGLLGAYNAAEAARANATYEGTDPYGDLSGLGTPPLLSASVTRFSQRYQYYLDQEGVSNGNAAYYNSLLSPHVNERLWDNNHRHWDYCCVHWNYYDYEIYLRRTGSDYGFEYNDDGSWSYVSGDSAESISGGNATVHLYWNYLSNLRQSRQNATTYTAKR
jgi:hypothetical protein